jgi:heat-inducible transcriptional repressor
MEGREIKAELSDKHMSVLDAVVTTHIRQGLPVGSKYVAGRFDIGLGPASVRNLMADLESMGLLVKPHISAGRVPTSKGYRAFVDRFARAGSPGRRESATIRRALEPGLPVERMLRRVSQVLESLSDQMGFAFGPERVSGRVSRLDVTRSTGNAVLVTIEIGSRAERTAPICLDSPAEAAAAARILKRLARTIVGKDIASAARAIGTATLRELGRDAKVSGLRRTLRGLMRPADSELYVSGTGNVVYHMEDRMDARCFLEILESSQAAATALAPGRGFEGATVSIGEENKPRPMRSCSVVRSPFWMGDARGAIGVVGPVRMEYRRVIALVDYAAGRLTRILSKRGGT